MMISTRKGVHGRRIRRAVKILFGLGAGYSRVDEKPTLEVVLDGQDNVCYTVNLTSDDLDRLVAAREYYQANGSWKDRGSI